MRGNSHVRFGGRAEETDQPQDWHRASARPNHGSSTRRDIRLEYAERLWRLEAREGDRVLGRWLYDTEDGARDDVRQLIDSDEMPTADWREITAAFRASEASARRRRETPP